MPEVCAHELSQGMAAEADTAHRIFRNEQLHRLQVRFPWFFGYAFAPLAFYLGQGWYGRSALTWLSRLSPLLAQAGASEAARQAHATTAASLFIFHFVRRAVEVVCVNDYTGTWNRDSRLELMYYLAWGFLAGSSAGERALALHGVASLGWRIAGTVLFAAGECGNAWCHLELRRLRAARQALGSHYYAIPSRGPFAFIASPHYSFELLTWFGFWVHGGFDAVGLLLLVMSVTAMGAFASDRHAKYVALFQAGDRSAGDPRARWKMVPLLW